MSVYAILCTSPYTKDDILNYKSLDSFENFQTGWVREVLVKEVSERKIIIRKVIAETDGRILAVHCNCMAGLGETCSHAASLLWTTAAGVERRDSLTVTHKSAYWVMPPTIKTVPYAPLADINSVGKKRKSTCIATTSPVDASFHNEKETSLYTIRYRG